MTEQSPPMRRAIPAALVVARRAMVVAAASMVIAALAVVVALLGEPGTDPAETAALEQARDDAASAQDEADAANALADAAIVIAEEAKALAVAAEAALADAVASAGETVDPATIARLEAQLEEARNLAATALVAADAAAGTTDAPGAADAAPDDGAAVEDEPMSEEEPAPDDGSGSADTPVVEEEPMPEEEPVPEDDGTDGAVALPGEQSEFGPSAGTGLAVVGIRYDSALNFRDAPNGTIIGRLDNVMDGVRDPAVYVRQPGSDAIITTVDLQNGVVATGNTRQLPTTVWHELQVGELLGWASGTFLAPVGGTDDATSEVVGALGELPVADTMVELGLAVGQTMASQEPQSSVVVSGEAGLFEDLGQVTIDIVGIGDDSVRGFRLVIFAHPAENWTQDDPGPFTLKSVERTVLCHSHRGVSDGGVCN